MRVLIAACLLTLAFATPAFAGGWAVTTLDQLPPEFHAGQTYDIGYTIRQHGVTPVNVESALGSGGTTEIQILGPDGHVSLSFRGLQTGPTGHYVASVRFPTEGKWNWQVTQGPFAPQQLSTVDVLAAGGAASAQPAAPAGAPAQASAPNALLITALLLAVSGAALLLGSRTRGIRRPADPGLAMPDLRSEVPLEELHDLRPRIGAVLRLLQAMALVLVAQVRDLAAALA
jgi:hypothetical protein